MRTEQSRKLWKPRLPKPSVFVPVQGFWAEQPETLAPSAEAQQRFSGNTHCNNVCISSKGLFSALLMKWCGVCRRNKPKNGLFSWHYYSRCVGALEGENSPEGDIFLWKTMCKKWITRHFLWKNVEIVDKDRKNVPLSETRGTNVQSKITRKCRGAFQRGSASL